MVIFFDGGAGGLFVMKSYTNEQSGKYKKIENPPIIKKIENPPIIFHHHHRRHLISPFVFHSHLFLPHNIHFLSLVLFF